MLRWPVSDFTGPCMVPKYVRTQVAMVGATFLLTHGRQCLWGFGCTLATSSLLGASPGSPRHAGIMEIPPLLTLSPADDCVGEGGRWHLRPSQFVSFSSCDWENMLCLDCWLWSWSTKHVFQQWAQEDHSYPSSRSVMRRFKVNACNQETGLCVWMPGWSLIGGLGSPKTQTCLLCFQTPHILEEKQQAEDEKTRSDLWDQLMGHATRKHLDFHRAKNLAILIFCFVFNIHWNNCSACWSDFSALGWLYCHGIFKTSKSIIFSHGN